MAWQSGIRSKMCSTLVACKVGVEACMLPLVGSTPFVAGTKSEVRWHGDGWLLGLADCEHYIDIYHAQSLGVSPVASRRRGKQGLHIWDLNLKQLECGALLIGIWAQYIHEGYHNTWEFVHDNYVGCLVAQFEFGWGDNIQDGLAMTATNCIQLQLEQRDECNKLCGDMFT